MAAERRVPDIVCAHCKTVLGIHQTDDGFTYVHLQPMGTVNHQPQPIQRPRGQTIRCDFCYTSTATWRLPSRPFTLPWLDGEGMAGGWAACNRCAALIERNQWDLLAARVVSILEGTYRSLLAPDSDLMASMIFTYEQLRKNITGPLELLDE